jgi:hypothetical protein
MGINKYTPKEVDAILEKTFLGKHCCLTLPGYLPVYGIVRSICMDPRKIAERVINIQINGREKVYTVELQWLSECLKVTKEKDDGNTH